MVFNRADFERDSRLLRQGNHQSSTCPMYTSSALRRHFVESSDVTTSKQTEHEYVEFMRYHHRHWLGKGSQGAQHIGYDTSIRSLKGPWFSWWLKPDPAAKRFSRRCLRSDVLARRGISHKSRHNMITLSIGYFVVSVSCPLDWRPKFRCGRLVVHASTLALPRAFHYIILIVMRAYCVQALLGHLVRLCPVSWKCKTKREAQLEIAKSPWAAFCSYRSVISERIKMSVSFRAMLMQMTKAEIHRQEKCANGSRMLLVYSSFLRSLFTIQ